MPRPPSIPSAPGSSFPSIWPNALVLILVVGAFATVNNLIAPDLNGILHDAVLLAFGAAAAWIAFRFWSSRAMNVVLDRGRTAAVEVREQAQAETQGHLARIRAIVETATEGIITIDQSGNVDTFNGAAERLFGYEATEILGRNVSLLMPSPFAGEHDAYIRRYLATGEKRIIGIGREVIGRRKDGTVFPIDLSVGEGAVGGQRFFTAVIRDVSERKEMQTKLSQAERLAAVGELAAGVAHEVNNPINTIINCAQLIQDGDDPRLNSRIVREEGERIASIVQDLLQFAKDDRDLPQTTSIHEVLERTLRLVGENFKRHGIDLHIAVPETIPPVKARPQQLQQVLLNLLINAKDALIQDGTRSSREVRLSASADELGVLLRVRDNGPGIPSQLGNRIFEPFVTTKRAKGGTGLGLSISKSIVEGYGGAIEVQSEPGLYAEFRVWLPRATEGRE